MSDPDASRLQVDLTQSADSAPGSDPDDAWDFFISRAGPDAAFSSEIARVLKAEGWRVLVQEQDFANHSFMERIHAGLKSAARVIALLSPDYLNRDHCEAEWQAALADDPLNRNRRLIVMRVRESKPEGLLATFAYWDLVPLRDNPALFQEVILAAARNETPAVAAPYWQHPEAMLHNDIRVLPAFTGRRDDLNCIHSLLQAEPHPAAVKIVAVKGVPGVGKSMLVRKYAWDNRGHYAGVWLLPAESESLVLDGLITLGTTFLRGLDQVKDRHQAAQQTLRLIEGGGFEKPWLLIYDNVEKPDTIARLTPRNGAHVLVTTRWADWYGQAAELSIDVFSEPAAVEFLLNRSQSDDGHGASQLVAQLGYLPLALEHAGSYCKASGTAFDAYRASLAELIKRKPRDAAYPDSVFATFNLAIERAIAATPDAERLMGFLAYLAPDHIPLSLVTADIMSDIARGEAVAALTEVSLLTLIPSVKVSSPAVDVHRLVQQTMRTRLSESGVEPQISAISRRLVARAVHALPFARDDVRSWPAFTTLLPHALAVIQTPDSPDGADAKHFLLHEIGTYHDARGELDKAEAYLRFAVVSVAADGGWGDPNLVVGMRNLSTLLKRKNKLDEAEDYSRRAVEIASVLFEPDHVEVARSLKNLASVLCVTRKYDEAESHIRRALAITEATLPTNHPETSDSLHILATLLQATGRRDEAEPLLQRSLSINEACFGENHPMVATTLSDIGALLFAENRLLEAEPLYRRALAIDEAAFDPTHPNIARDLNNLAALLHATDNFGEAEKLYRRALDIEEMTFGPDHPAVATASNNLARLLQAAGQPQQAEMLFKRAISIQQKALPENHPEAATTLIGYAELLYAMKRADEAVPTLQRALTMTEATFGSDHPNVSTVLNKLAFLLSATRRFREAEPLYRRAITITEVTYGPDHRSLPDLIGNLAGLLVDENRSAEAEPLYRRALSIAETAFPPNHPKTAVSLHNLAIVLRDSGRSSEAEQLLRRTIAMKESSLGPDHPELAVSLNALAKLYLAAGRLDEAEPLCRRALIIAEQQLGPAHSATEKMQANLSEILAARVPAPNSSAIPSRQRSSFWARLFSRS